ncbi:MAG: lipopolysaccharide transport periplasmic protein LptA [Gammaproteobacteria bacterium]|nr:lipopolysaccharide transport periplasmic protein LptA [Gammaproteobacteria bacterium]
MTNIFRYSLLTGLLFATQSNIWAAEQVEKIFIEADHMQLNINTGFSVYTGNVKITQGELKLAGDKVTLQQSKDEVERITVTGRPAHYNHVTDKGENIQAESEHMVYTASQNKLVMTVNAKLKQPDHQVSSQKNYLRYGEKNRYRWR